MSAAELVGALRTRGVELVAAGDRLPFRPVAAVTPDELTALRAQKAAILSLLRAETSAALSDDDTLADGVPDGPCGLCGAPLAWVEDWPSPGDARWLCPTCAAWPAPSLAEVFQALTTEERQRLDAEVISGDHLSGWSSASCEAIEGQRRDAEPPPLRQWQPAALWILSFHPMTISGCSSPSRAGSPSFPCTTFPRCSPGWRPSRLAWRPSGA